MNELSRFDRAIAKLVPLPSRFEADVPVTSVRPYSPYLWSIVVHRCRLNSLSELDQRFDHVIPPFEAISQSKNICLHESCDRRIAFARESLRGETFGLEMTGFDVDQTQILRKQFARDTLLRESSILGVRRLQHAADLVLFNVGTVEDFLPNNPYLAGYNVGLREVDEIRRDELVGEIATTYFRTDGTTTDVDINERTSGPNLDRLKSARYRICATSGEHKVRALNAALEGGYISHLVVDTETAASLLSLE